MCTYVHMFKSEQFPSDVCGFCSRGLLKLLCAPVVRMENVSFISVQYSYSLSVRWYCLAYIIIFDTNSLNSPNICKFPVNFIVCNVFGPLCSTKVHISEDNTNFKKKINSSYVMFAVGSDVMNLYNVKVIENFTL